MKKIKNTSFIYIIVIVFFKATLLGQVVEKVLPTPESYQERSNWCWAACCASLLSSYDAPSQCAIANYARDQNPTYFGAVDCCKPWSECNKSNHMYVGLPPIPPYPDGSLEDILSHFSSLSSTIPTITSWGSLGELTFNDILFEINNDYPFIIRWGWYPPPYNNGHFILCRGYKEVINPPNPNEEWVHYMDPMYGYEIKLYSWMLDNSEHKWTHTLELTTSPTLPGPPVAKTWAPSGTNNDWFTPDNWLPTGVPITEDITINATPSTMPVISNGIATTGALNITTGASLTVASDGGLSTYGLFNNDGTFLIQSDNSIGYSGTYIDMGGIAGSGTFEFHRNIINSGTVHGSSNPNGWHYLSAPFDGFTSDDIFDYYSNKWDRTGGPSNTGAWIHMPTPPNPSCTPWPTEPLNVMDAWSINYANDYACNAINPGTGMQVEFVSNAAGVHTGDYIKALGYGASGYQMFNLIGNPYPSSLNVNTITFGSNIVQAIAVYDGNAGNYLYWASGLGSYDIAPTLGFFVETTNVPATLTVKNTNRFHYAHHFWKSDVANILTIQASSNGKSDILHVRFADDVTSGMDMNGDAHKLIAGTEGLPQIYTMAGNDMLAINALPATESVPMGFTANGSGTYSIEAIETSDFDEVYLEDKITGVLTDLLSDSYTFYYNDGDEPNRFTIHFGDISTSTENSGLVIYSNQSNIVIYNINNQQGDVSIYNVVGQFITSRQLEDGLNNITLDNSQGYYIVNVRTSESVVNRKVYIH